MKQLIEKKVIKSTRAVTSRHLYSSETCSEKNIYYFECAGNGQVQDHALLRRHCSWAELFVCFRVVIIAQ